jgi:hypothetical protein
MFCSDNCQEWKEEIDTREESQRGTKGGEEEGDELYKV